MPALDKEQRKVALNIMRVGKKRGVSNKDIVTALITGLQESGLRNLKGGDADSSGWRQERDEYYPSWNKNVGDDTNRFYDELSKVGPGSVGERAQAVQRSAYPGLYQPHVGEARAIMKALRPLVGGGPQKGLKRPGAKRSIMSSEVGKTATPAVPSQNMKLAALDFIQNRNDPNAVLQFAQAKKAAEASQETLTSSKVNPLKLKPQKGNTLGTGKKLSPHGSSLVRWANAVEGTREGGLRQIKWANAAGVSSSAPWCSAFVAYGIRKQGLTPPSDPAYSGSWLSWKGGKKVNYKNAKPGDLLVFDWGDGGITDHVAIYKGNGQMIAGNTSNSTVASSSVPVGNIVGVVRPKR